MAGPSLAGCGRLGIGAHKVGGLGWDVSCIGGGQAWALSRALAGTRAGVFGEVF